MKKKTPKMDMGGLYTGASKSRDVENQPVSGYGTSQSSADGPWRPKTGFGRFVQRVTGIGDNKGFDYKGHAKSNRHAGKNAGKPCRRGSNGQMICS